MTQRFFLTVSFVLCVLISACGGGSSTTSPETPGTLVSGSRIVLTVEPPQDVSIDSIELVNAGIKLVKEGRSEEHTSELQSRRNLVCRLLLEKKKNKREKNKKKKKKEQ